MEERIILAGAGGQGMMTVGKLLAETMMHAGKEVTFFPSYGSEVRGGTAHCHVVLSDSEIYSPMVETATRLVVMNEPSYRKFSPLLGPGGTMLVNSTMVSPDEPPLDAHVLPIAATEIANDLGNRIAANIVMLGALVTVCEPLAEGDHLQTMERWIKGKRPKLVELNRRAFQAGAECARTLW